MNLWSFFLYLIFQNQELMNASGKNSKIKNIVIAIFALEQVIIIYIIATRKGMSIIDWISNLF